MTVAAGRICVLVSVGRNSVSGRARRAEMDARAVELALRTVQPDRITLLHAGASESAALHDYLGMGVPELACLAVPPNSDPIPSLIAWLRHAAPALILAGIAAEAGEGSGQLPYIVAHALALPLVPAISAILPGSADGMRFEQPLPGGRRRHVGALGPVIATVCAHAPSARLPTRARAMRGHITRSTVHASPDAAAGWVRKPARARPTRILQVTAGSAADRLRALRGATPAADQEQAALTGLSADEAAGRIITYLSTQGLLPASSAIATGTQADG